MKNIFLALTFAFAAITAQARETIQIVWPFNLGDTIAQPTRATVDEANRIQDKYNFIMINKPGAGASIAAKFVESTPNSILSGSTSFFVRPNFFPESSHSPANFRVLMVQCSAPMMIVSSKYRSFNEVPQNQFLTIGVSGLGVTTHLVATETQKRFPQLKAVPYKGTSEPMIDILEGRVDMGVTFVNTAEQWLQDGKMQGLGVTGGRSVIGVPTLASQNFHGMDEVVNTLMFMVPTSMSKAQYNELRDILRRAARSQSVQAAYTKEYCSAMDLTEQQTQAWYTTQQTLWKRLTKDIKLESK